MGSPLTPALANLFMGHHEHDWLIQKEVPSVLFDKRYVDNIFCIFRQIGRYLFRFFEHQA